MPAMFNKLFSLSALLACCPVGISGLLFRPQSEISHQIQQDTPEKSSLIELDCDHAEWHAEICDDLCVWVNYTRGVAQPMQVCGKHCNSNDQKDDMATHGLRSGGHRDDCDSLTTMFNNIDSTAQHHLEVGANIGACVVELIAHTDARITAFEMKEDTANRLRCTVHKMTADQSSRVTIFGTGLSSVDPQCLDLSTNDCITGGATVLSKSTATSTREPATRLDLLNLDASQYRTVKMDIESHEMHAMRGGSSFFHDLPHGAHLKTEFHYKGADATEYINLLASHNFCHKTDFGDDKVYYKANPGECTPN